MCDPVTMAVVAGAGALVSAYGQIQQGKAAQKTAEYNAAINKKSADDAINRGREEENKQRRITDARIGAQRAQFAANGVSLDSGSALDILEDTAEIGELDALTIRGNSQREANRYSQQAELNLFEGRQARSNGYTDAFGTLLTGAGRVASIWEPKPKPAGS